VVKQDLSEVRFQLESDNPAAHAVKLRFPGLRGSYTVADASGASVILPPLSGPAATVSAPAKTGVREGTVATYTETQEAVVEVRMDAGAKAKAFFIRKKPQER